MEFTKAGATRVGGARVVSLTLAVEVLPLCLLSVQHLCTSLYSHKMSSPQAWGLFVPKYESAHDWQHSLKSSGLMWWHICLPEMSCAFSTNISLGKECRAWKGALGLWLKNGNRKASSVLKRGGSQAGIREVGTFLRKRWALWTLPQKTCNT